jgi:hypothetical protein
MGFIALPAVAALRGTANAAGADSGLTYTWDKTGNVQPATALLPDERSSPRQSAVQIAQVALIIGLAGLGLAITFTSLFSDMKRRRRAVYRPRGP